ncbi:MAG: primosomal protein N' [candidate division Zixibacteria bacterium]|nr:primosomal protein N' [candidate division Zixibacteria bacterium]
MSESSKLAEIAVTGPLRRSFIYHIPESIGPLEPGQRLLVPFGRMRKVGYYLRQAQPPQGIELKAIIKTVDNISYFDPLLFRFCSWIADYYFANPADCLSAALPSVLKGTRTVRYIWQSCPDWLSESIKLLCKPYRPLVRKALTIIKKERGLLNRLLREGAITEDWSAAPIQPGKKLSGMRAAEAEIWREHFQSRRIQQPLFDGVRTRAKLKENGWTEYQIREALKGKALLPVYRDEGYRSIMDFVESRDDVRAIHLNKEQQTVLDKLRSFSTGKFQPTLLHGVTGSGKTIVYCHLCQDILAKGKSALILTPEIALAGTTLSYFRGFFGDLVTVIHSAMTERERLESWRGIRSGRFRIVVGPRSAIFAPLPDPGLIIVDEEHDPSYKQNDPAPRFHGRDAAIMRGRISDVPVVLGTASPSLESYQNVQSGRYRLLRLTERPGGATLPVVHLVDMRKERLRGDLPFFSFPLKRQIEEQLTENKQVILFLNRRGHSPQLKCSACGEVPQCPNCLINLTYHKIGRKLTCHYCGYVRTDYDHCPHCQGSDFMYLGAGTQKVEEALPRLFPDARVSRLDSDSASGRKRAYQILSDFAAKKNNLLLGTQMVTKGLDFPDVTLVGVLSADLSLDLPDFRASERTFARLLQVAGRSGRSSSPGEVLIQTYYPESDIINDAARQDYESFFKREIESRRALSFPPFSHLVGFTLSGMDEKKLEKTSLDFRKRLSKRLERNGLKVELLGPAPCPLYHLRGKYRRHLFAKTQQIVKFVRMLTEWENDEARFKLPSSIKLTVDVDPSDMM